MRDANLTQIHALDTDFRGANLTGACIKNWNINSETKFDGVICDYVYLESNQQKRYPPAPETFKPGDFAKLFQTVGETIELFFREGIDWHAFLAAFNEFKQTYSDEEFSVQSIEQKMGGSLLVKLTVPENSTEQKKAKYTNSLHELYESKLKLIEQQKQLLEKTVIN